MGQSGLNKREELKVMHPIRNVALTIMVSGVLMFACGLGYAGSDRFGAPISNRQGTPMVDVFDDPDKYNGKTVTLKGIIDMQDPKGYWFYLSDKEARIYVDLYESGFTISALTGKAVLVEGVIEVKLKIPSLLAKGVEPL